MGEKEIDLLTCFYLNHITKRALAITINDVAEKLPELEAYMPYSTIYKSAEKLTDMRLLGYGIKHGRARTYFLTERGVEFISQFLSELE